MSLSTEDAVRFAELRETVAWVAASSPFYRRKLAAAGIEPGEICSNADFRRLPITRKPEIPAAQHAAPPFGDLLAVAPDQIASIGISPGPLYIPRMASEPSGVEALHESLERMGVERTDVAHVTLNYHIMPGGLRLHRAFESFGCRVINGGVGNTELQVRVSSELGATVYAGTPSFLGKLVDVAEQEKRSLRYRIGFSTAETLTPALRAEMQQRIGIELFNHCGEALIGPLAGECRAHQGMHLHEREMYVEFLDLESGEPVAAGEQGELVVTQLGERAMPLLRYAPGDVFRLHGGSCSCGDTSPRIDFVGQVGSIRKIKGVLIHTAQVREALGAFPELGAFRIVVERAAGARHESATLEVACSAPDSALQAKVAERLRGTLLIQIDVQLVGKDADLGNQFVEAERKE